MAPKVETKGSNEEVPPPVTTTFAQRSSGAVIATVTVSNPKKMNSLSTVVLKAIVASINSLAQHPNLRCVILTGGELATPGSAFIGGADISELETITRPETARVFISRLHAACKVLRDLPIPVIARVNGHALGGGLIVMAATDLRIAAEGALFGMPEVRRGVPSTVDSALLPAAVGSLRARRLLLLGDTVSAEKAESWGLVDRVVPASELDSAVEEWVDLLLQAGPRALRGQKELMSVWDKVRPQEAIEAGVWEFGKAFEDVDGSESEPQRMIREFRENTKAKKSKI